MFKWLPRLLAYVFFFAGALSGILLGGDPFIYAVVFGISGFFFVVTDVLSFIGGR